MSRCDDLFIGIDGGGSKTLAALAGCDGEVLATASRGGSNPNDIGEAAAAGLISELIDELVLGREYTRLWVRAGISGAIGHERAISEKCMNLLGRKDGVTVSVTTDIINLMETAGDGDMAALICGSGSVCFVRRAGELFRIGGWGYLLDASGGGYALGRDGLGAALRFFDGRDTGAPRLYEAAREYLGGEPCESISRIYAGGKEFIAGFAPYVLDAAKDGDAASLYLTEKNAEYIAELLLRASELLCGGSECVADGGMLKNEFFLDILKQKTAHLPLKLTSPRATQLQGALNAALKMKDRP